LGRSDVHFNIFRLKARWADAALAQMTSVPRDLIGRRESSVGYPIIRDQSAGMPDILQPVAGRPRSLLANRKNNIVSTAAMHIPLLQRVMSVGLSARQLRPLFFR
jgi:hypothetical protein